jgi:hypothetical protein|tara:strand:+ start:14971 stop:15096 length:126 start_codon:yes stop_codon:yes gene_type:complete
MAFALNIDGVNDCLIDNFLPARVRLNFDVFNALIPQVSFRT